MGWHVKVQLKNDENYKKITDVSKTRDNSKKINCNFRSNSSQSKQYLKILNLSK